MSAVQKNSRWYIVVFIIEYVCKQLWSQSDEQPSASERYEKMIEQDIREIYEGITNYKIIDIEREFKGKVQNLHW